MKRKFSVMRFILHTFLRGTRPSYNNEKIIFNLNIFMTDEPFKIISFWFYLEFYTILFTKCIYSIKILKCAFIIWKLFGCGFFLGLFFLTRSIDESYSAYIFLFVDDFYFSSIEFWKLILQFSCKQKATALISETFCFLFNHRVQVCRACGVVSFHSFLFESEML